MWVVFFVGQGALHGQGFYSMIRTVGGGVQSWWGVRLWLLIVVQCLGLPVSTGHLPVLV